MNETHFRQAPILVLGSCRLTSSLLACLLQAGHRVTLCSPQPADVEDPLRAHLRATEGPPLAGLDYTHCPRLPDLPDPSAYALALAITPEHADTKTTLLRQLEATLDTGAVLAVNTESIPLDVLQQECLHPERVLGANWAEPVHTTLFLELITNDRTHPDLAEALCQTARDDWGKDPYVLREGRGIRGRLFSALLREAFFLVENGYVSVEGVDRCCRNDAGYYLPFAGNFRYMDLMGTYIYGLVMRELNPELTKNPRLPPFFEDLLRRGGEGMANGRGFYQYSPGERETWEAQAARFSYQIADLIRKYPFSYADAPRREQPSLVHE